MNVQQTREISLDSEQSGQNIHCDAGDTHGNRHNVRMPEASSQNVDSSQESQGTGEEFNDRPLDHEAASTLLQLQSRSAPTLVTSDMRTSGANSADNRSVFTNHCDQNIYTNSDRFRVSRPQEALTDRLSRNTYELPSNRVAHQNAPLYSETNIQNTIPGLNTVIGTMQQHQINMQQQQTHMYNKQETITSALNNVMAMLQQLNKCSQPNTQDSSTKSTELESPTTIESEYISQNTPELQQHDSTVSYNFERQNRRIDQNAVNNTTCTPYDSNTLLPERHSFNPRGVINSSSDMGSNQLIDDSRRYRNDERVPQAETSQLSRKRQANARSDIDQHQVHSDTANLGYSTDHYHLSDTTSGLQSAEVLSENHASQYSHNRSSKRSYQPHATSSLGAHTLANTGAYSLSNTNTQGLQSDNAPAQFERPENATRIYQRHRNSKDSMDRYQLYNTQGNQSTESTLHCSQGRHLNGMLDQSTERPAQYLQSGWINERTDQSTESPAQYLQRGWVNERADQSTESPAQYSQSRWINERPEQRTEDATQYSRRRTINGRPDQRNRSSNWESNDIKLPPFNGKEDWKVWINRFETVAERKHWDEETRLDNLIPRLQGKAGDFVFTQLSRHTLRKYSELIKELNSRFRVVETTKTYAARFSQRSQKPGETAEEYAAELKRLYAKAYEFRDYRTRQEDLVRRFLDGLRDADARFEIEYNKEPEDIDEAVYHAVNFVQTRHRSSTDVVSDRRNKKYARRMNSSSDSSDDNSDLEDDGEMINRAYRVPNDTEKGQSRRQKVTEQKKGLSEQTPSSQTESMNVLADTKGMMETFISQLQEIMQSGSNQSNRMPQMQPSRGKTVVCYGCQQTGHYLRECPQKVSRPFNRYTRQKASTNKVDEPQQRESKPITQTLN